MGMHSIHELFEHELRDIYGGERSLVEALGQMAAETIDPDMRKSYSQHRKETQAQIKRLEKIFRLIGMRAEAGTCPGIEGLLKEKKLLLREKPSPELLEFFNVGAGQKVERYEITSYENLIDMADKLEMPEVVELLEQTLSEEEAALNTLKTFASEYDVAEEVQSA